MKITGALSTLVLFGLLMARMGRSVDPTGSSAPDGQVREAKPLAVVMAESFPAKRADGDGKTGLAPQGRPTNSEAADAEEIQAVRDLSEALSSADPLRREQAFTKVLPVLVALDPVAAGHLAETWERGAIRAEFLERLAFERTKRDWMSSLMWADNLGDRAERVRTLAAVSLQVSRDDAVAATAIRLYFRI